FRGAKELAPSRNSAGNGIRSRAMLSDWPCFVLPEVAGGPDDPVRLRWPILQQGKSKSRSMSDGNAGFSTTSSGSNGNTSQRRSRELIQRLQDLEQRRPQSRR